MWAHQSGRRENMRKREREKKKMMMMMMTTEAYPLPAHTLRAASRLCWFVVAVESESKKRKTTKEARNRKVRQEREGGGMCETGEATFRRL
jgi:hypothetical protein